MIDVHFDNEINVGMFGCIWNLLILSHLKN